MKPRTDLQVERDYATRAAKHAALRRLVNRLSRLNGKGSKAKARLWGETLPIEELKAR